MTTISVLPGDGIGPEVTSCALEVLKQVRPDCKYVTCAVGAAAIAKFGDPYPLETEAVVKRSAAILFGAVGGTEFDGKPVQERPEWALFRLRKENDLYANIRPVRIFDGLEDASSLKPELVRGLDLIVLRELTSGLYFGHKETRIIDGIETSIDTLLYNAKEIERIARFGFELARGRRKHLTSVDKLNVLETSRLWRRIVIEVAKDFPDVELDHMLVDNAAMQLIRDPQRFDVIVTENTFGDILSDEAAMLTGSIGNLPSASLGGGGSGARFGLYEPISGTAPDIAGQGIANPTAAILSAAMLARYSLNDPESAKQIEDAVAEAIRAGARTRDLAGSGVALGTIGFTDIVLRKL
ncbi:MAG TPA: 3-isopropylmalate dehydrogenase [Candidatus Binatia bacterium]|nr:3-isopropylmalate dehydrogenase [Candidatus Binatia bacterium]